VREQSNRARDGQLPGFSAERVDCGDEVILALHGEFDLGGVAGFERVVSQVAPGSSVILDLRDISFMDSSGLQQLITLQRRATAEGWSLRLANPQQQVVRLLQISGVGEFLTIAQDRQPNATG
jgi:stage II sporulation protein AA (anti-sigma F factor antagonist)